MDDDIMVCDGTTGTWNIRSIVAAPGPNRAYWNCGSKGAGGAGLKAKCVCFNNAGPMLNRTEASTTV